MQTESGKKKKYHWVNVCSVVHELKCICPPRPEHWLLLPHCSSVKHRKNISFHTDIHNVKKKKRKRGKKKIHHTARYWFWELAHLWFETAFTQVAFLFLSLSSQHIHFFRKVFVITFVDCEINSLKCISSVCSSFTSYLNRLKCVVFNIRLNYITFPIHT